MRQDFFDAAEPQSLIKSKLVLKYFRAWSDVILPRLKRPGDKLAYLDLFAGPGRFGDGEPSTPLLVLERAIEVPTLRERLVTIFNDSEPAYVNNLIVEIQQLSGIQSLVTFPKVTNFRVGTDAIEEIRSVSQFPTLFFIDPFGYKGLSLDMIGSTIRNWGCDCIFFFNYNRISPGISNPMVVPLIDELFGKDRASRLRIETSGVSPNQRREIVLAALIEGLREVGGKFVLPFEFKRNSGERTSHFIVFVSKVFIGYHIMKEVMASVSTDEGSVKNFEYIPFRSPQLSFSFADPRLYTIAALKELIGDACAGRTMPVWSIYEQNTIDTPYTLKNVQAALLELESDELVEVDKPSEKRIRKGVVTIGKDRMVTFPMKE